MKKRRGIALLSLAAAGLVGLAGIIFYAPGRTAAARQQVREKLSSLEAVVGGGQVYRTGEAVSWGQYRCLTCGREQAIRVNGVPLSLCQTCQNDRFERL